MELEPRTDDNSMKPDSPFLKVEEMTREISKNTAKHYHITDTMREFLEGAKFTDIHEERVKMPIGAWPSDPRWREIGILYADYVKTGIQGWMLQMLTTAFGVRIWFPMYQVTNRISGRWSGSTSSLRNWPGRSIYTRNMFITLGMELLNFGISLTFHSIIMYAQKPVE